MTRDACGKQADPAPTPLELTERIGALLHPPRTHRHRYCAMLAPDSPLRASVTAEPRLMMDEEIPARGH